MNLYLRLLRVMLRNLPLTALHYSEAVESRFRVFLHDIDAFGHMNNGRYLQIMDVARTDWMQRTRVLATIRRQRWIPVLGGGVIRYRFSLRLLQPYVVRTQLLGWDERWFYLEHSFIDRRERCVAVGVSRAAMRQEGQWVPANTVANAVDPAAESPEVPAYIREWLGLEDAMFRVGRDRQRARVAALRGVG